MVFFLLWDQIPGAHCHAKLTSFLRRPHTSYLNLPAISPLDSKEYYYCHADVFTLGTAGTEESRQKVDRMRETSGSLGWAAKERSAFLDSPVPPDGGRTF